MNTEQDDDDYQCAIKVLQYPNNRNNVLTFLCTSCTMTSSTLSLPELKRTSS